MMPLPVRLRTSSHWLFMALGLASAAACSGRADGDGADTGDARAPERDARTDVVDASVDAATLVVPPACAAMLQPPSDLACTGLYTDVATKALAPQVRAYAPAVPLWADGSGKDRWIYLPPGQTIDATDPNEWTFPVGTRAWKQFSRSGKRIETRFFEKVGPATWDYGTYAWSADESSANLSPGGDISLAGDGGTYHIPTIGECGECHGGRTDRLLGFEQVSLGLTGATGLTLEELVKESLLSPAPALTHLSIGDDGTGLAAAPLSWLHINCGAACHNTNEGAAAYGVGMVLRLDPTQLDGRASTSFPSRLTTIGVAATVFGGHTRIVPGDVDDSLLHTLINERGTVQMPPIASLLVDTPDVAAVASWIRAMPPLPDAGSDAQDDALSDASADAPPEASTDAAGGDATLDATSDAPLDAASDVASPDGGADGTSHDAAPLDAADGGPVDAARDALDATAG